MGCGERECVCVERECVCGGERFGREGVCVVRERVGGGREESVCVRERVCV